MNEALIKKCMWLLSIKYYVERESIMITLSPRTVEKLDDEIETSDILASVGYLDQIRIMLGDDEDSTPSRIRHDLLKLHELLFKIIRERYKPGIDDGDTIYELVDDIEETLTSIVENAEKILEIIAPIQDILLDASSEDDEDEEDDDEEYDEDQRDE